MTNASFPSPDFDTIIDRRGTHSSKWDMMERTYGVPAETGLAMWVADMDFAAPHCVSAALQKMVDHGIYGYFGDDAAYKAAVIWWMENRHGWTVSPEWIFSTHGLVNGTAMCLDAFSAPGDGVVITTPVYHAFASVIKASGRQLVECPLTNTDGHYTMDFAHWDSLMTGNERIFILCSPHNPGGRVWSSDELRGVADFCRRHDLVLVSDEIHHDLVMPGHRHLPMALAAPDITDRLVMMTASTKTFNIAGGHTGNVIIADPALRARFGARMAGLGLSPNAFGLHMATAAYSPEGAAWVDALMTYIDKNRQILESGLRAIPGLRPMTLEATYLCWVDFSNTGMDMSEVLRRVQQEAQIAPNHGTTFGLGGAPFLRFNIGTQRARIVEAVERMQTAFKDLQ